MTISIRLRNLLRHLFLLFAVWSSCEIPAAAADKPRFIDVNPKNVCRADGSPLPGDLAKTGWKWNPDMGNGGIFESNPDALAETLMVEVTGLEPNKAYEIFGYFWADGYGLDHPETRAQRAAQFGTSLATLHTFDGPNQPVRGHVCAWQVTPGGTAGAAYGLKSTIEEEQPLKGLEKLQLRHDNARLVRARVGQLRADGEGKLPVFFADYPYRRPRGPAWIDGVAVRPVDVDGPLEEGWKKGTWLHLALRAGDSITIERELKRRAAINTLDEEHLSPLFYATVSGDAVLVKRLLDLGADPNLSSQAGTPLCTAAISSREDLVKMLLDAGAQVPAKVAEDSGTLTTKLHPAHLHPVIGAMRAGSVPILKLLLAKQPAIDVLKLMVMPPMKLGEKFDFSPPARHILDDVIDAGLWDMVVYLMDQGCAPSGLNKTGNHVYANKWMIACVLAGEPAMPALEHLLKAGVTPVDPKANYMLYRHGADRARKHDGGSGRLQPHDALSAAVWAGNVTIAKRFLPLARNAPHNYLEMLHLIALHAQNQEILQAIQGELGNVRPQRWNPTKDHDPQQKTLRDEDLRVYLPRTTNIPARPGHKPGQYVLGVIASPTAKDAGTALTATASTAKGWQAVDRELIEQTLQEDDFDKPWLKGQHQMALIGDRLKADALAVVDSIKSDKDSLYSFEIVEVATGLVVHREHLLASTFDPQKDLAALLERSTRALDAAAANARREAITLLSFTARGALPNELALAKLLQATIQRQIDSTPGWISLTRSQSDRLIEEQAMQGKNSVWGAAHLVEGSIFPAQQPDMITVSVRLETLKPDRTSVKTDAEATGSIHDPQLVVSAAWRDLLRKTHDMPITGNPAIPQDASATTIAQQEAERLAREASWLMAARISPEHVEPLIYSARALDGPLSMIVRTHLNLLFMRIESLACETIGDPASTTSLTDGVGHMQHLPVGLDLSDRMVHELPMARELLHQAAYYFELQTKDRAAVNRRDNMYWLVINALSYLRAAIYKDHIPDGSRNEFTLFCQELDAFTRSYHDMLALEPNPDIGRLRLYCGGYRWIYLRNPELYQGLLRNARRINRLGRMLPHDLSKGIVGGKMARDLLTTFDGETSLKAELFKAEMGCYLAEPDEAASLTRRFIAAAMNYNRIEWYMLGNSTEAAASMAKRYTTSSWFESTKTGGSELPTLVHTPRPAPEAIRNPDFYLGTHYYRHALPRPMEDRWFQLGSSGDYFDSNMRNAVTQKDPELLRGLLDATRLHHLYSGHDHWQILGKRYNGLLQQMTEPDTLPRTILHASLIGDFRKATIPNAGCAVSWMRDEENPEILWVYYYSTTTNTLGISPSGGLTSDSSRNFPSTEFQHLWLLAFNCLTGEIRTKVDLHKEALKAIGCDQPPGPTHAWRMQFDQNRNTILMNAHSTHGRGGNGHRHASRIIVIDKTSGRVRALPEGYLIADDVRRRTHAGWVSVVGLGDDFYFIDENGYKAANGQGKRDEAQRAISILKVDRDLNITPLVEHGRRPAVTPFDAPNSIPDEIAPHGGRLLVFNENQHSYYNPADGSWEDVLDHHTKFGFKMFHFDDRERNRVMDSAHKLKSAGKETGWKIDFRKLKPDKLWCVHDELGAVELSMELPIPEEFRQNITILTQVPEFPDDPSSNTSIPKLTPFDDYAKRAPFRVVVLNQTNDNLILGLQTNDNYHWRRPSREGYFLPLLWKVSKEQLMAALEQASRK